MRVGLVTERIGTALGGAERWTYDFARWLVTHGHEVQVVCRADRRCQLPPGVRQHAIKCGRTQMAFGAEAAARLRELRCDVTHDMGSGWNCDVFHPHCGSRAAAITRNQYRLRPVARQLAGAIQPRLPRYRTFNALCARQYAGTGRRFVAVSRMVARDFETRHGVAPQQIRVIHNGVDTERFSPVVREQFRTQVRDDLGFAAQDVVLLLVAHNPRLKGFSTLLQSAAELRRQGASVRLLIVGCEQTARYARQCRRLDVPAEFVGVVTKPQPYFAAADIYAHPTFYDPCSLVVLEAWACGLPVVTSQFNGCAELMEDSMREFVLPDPADARDLAKRLHPLLDRRFRLRVGGASRALAEAHQAEDCFSRVMDVYEEIRATRRAAA